MTRTIHLLLLAALVLAAAPRPSHGASIGAVILDQQQADEQVAWPARRDKTPLPVVLWHGMGDSCCGQGMSDIKAALEHEVPGVFVHSIRVGRDANEDTMRGFLDDVNVQTKQVCAKLKSMEKLKRGFHFIGFSQGGLFARSLVERCEGLKVETLITFAAPHQGIKDVPESWCDSQPVFCSMARMTIRYGAYSPLVQGKVVQAAYIKTPWNHNAYLRGNRFLPDINNENNVNKAYKERMTTLKALVLVRHEDDTVLSLRDSAWFYEDLMSGPVPFNETALYKDDVIGLRKLHKKGKVAFVTLPGDHMQFSIASFLAVVLPYLRDASTAVMHANEHVDAVAVRLHARQLAHTNPAWLDRVPFARSTL
ncbi:hypothetical protein AMAG_05362 [Allomyces macrogynus ATCC 38327]|uniref:Palmitoyl-protein thioesterase 1 n=1 Tax=Allomyces macrogynus (strain ATCC 38327) TaxID=578462 RepID=A0A0L0SBH5_ALLM3|nr:hypothetical protein AMAG_05362 [Allomyces macrogynus ATCC 38327]|eukprot:KNE59913.1 hypothetical protein AMAG_05362 [Allomyces macrogynus ATCC 38327]